MSSHETVLVQCIAHMEEYAQHVIVATFFSTGFTRKEELKTMKSTGILEDVVGINAIGESVTL